MKNRFKYNTKKDHVILYCPRLNQEGDAEVVIDKSFLKTAMKIDGMWSEMENPYYPDEPHRTTFATIHKGEFIDMKRVVMGIQHID